MSQQRDLGQLGDSLREEFIVCYAPGYPDPYRPHPNTLENAQRFVAKHNWNYGTNQPARPVVKRRLVSDWEEVEGPVGAGG